MPRSFGSHNHPTKRNQIVHLDYLYIGSSEQGSVYVLLMKDGLSHYVELEVAVICDGRTACEALIDWKKRYGQPKVIFSDQGSHFRNELMKELVHRMGMQHEFSTPYCPWSNGVAERPNQEILTLLKILCAEMKISFQKWPLLIPLIMGILNQTPLTCLGNKAPVEVFMGMERTDLLSLVFEDDIGFHDYPISPEEIVTLCKGLKKSIVEMEKNALDKKSKRQAQNNKGREFLDFPFEIGDYVIWSSVDRKGPGGKLYGTWKGPYQIVDSKSDKVFYLRNLVTSKLIEAHTSRMEFYSDAMMEVTQPLIELISRQGDELTIDKIEVMIKIQNRFILTVSWNGLEELEKSEEPFEVFFPQVQILVLQFMNELYDTEPGMVRQVMQKHKDIIAKEFRKRNIDIAKFPNLENFR